jgi:hypothetical protein
MPTPDNEEKPRNEEKPDAEDEIPKGLTPEAKDAFARFDACFKEQLTRILAVPIRVLVWGPNPTSSSPAAKKRAEIRDALKARGFCAVFSEELKKPEGSEEMSEKTVEQAQVVAAHLILVLLEGAPGALAELHDFVDDPETVGKIYAMVPSAYKEGYSANGAIRELDDGYGGVYWYGPDELEACHVLTRAVKRANARRQIAYRVMRRHHE